MKVYRLNSLENEKDQVIEFINKSIVWNFNINENRYN
jgi:hypothetical protein